MKVSNMDRIKRLQMASEGARRQLGQKAFRRRFSRSRLRCQMRWHGRSLTPPAGARRPWADVPVRQREVTEHGEALRPIFDTTKA